MSKCLILSRVSTLSQDLEQQTVQLVNEAHNRGYKDNEIIIVEDKESAIKLEEFERNTLNQMKMYVETEDVACVFIWEITRLSRKLPMLYSLRDYLQANHVQLYCHTPEFKLFDDDWKISQASNIVFALYAVMAESEMNIKKERFARGKAKKKAEGKFVGGKVLFGYKLDNENRFIIDEENAAIVQRIFSMYSSGRFSARQIARLLHDEGILKHDNFRSSETFINKLLANESYTGNGVYPAIISTDDFNIATKNRADYKIKPRRTYADNIYFGHKLLICGTNNHKLMVRKSDAAYIEPVSGFCISINMVDSLLLYCADKSYQEHGTRDLANYENKITKELANIEKRLNSYKDEEKKIQDSFDRIEERLILGNISYEKADYLENKLKEQRHNLTVSQQEDRNKKSTLQRELKAIQDKTGDHIVKDIYTLTAAEQRDMIHDEIKEVLINRLPTGQIYQLGVIYNNPILDGEIYTLHSKKHKIYMSTHTGEIEIPFKFIKRYARAK